MVSLCLDLSEMPLEILDKMQTTISISDYNAGTFVYVTSTGATSIVYEYILTNYHANI